MNEKETEENAQQQEHKFIIDMERECHQMIKEHEKNAKTEYTDRNEGEKNIQSARTSNDQEEIFKKILEKSIYEKARDKVRTC
jgi:hypothetical protein